MIPVLQRVADIDQGSKRGNGGNGGEGGLGWLVGQLLGIRRSLGTVSHLCGSTTVVLATWRLRDNVVLITFWGAEWRYLSVCCRRSRTDAVVASLCMW